MKKLMPALFILFAFTANAQTSDTAKTTITVDSAITKVEVEASFPGGEEKWNKFVQKVVEKSIDKLVKDKKSNGTCEMQFIVDKDGSLSNAEPLTLKDSHLAKILTKALKNGPKWIPASINGTPVKAWRRQKVTFRTSE